MEIEKTTQNPNSENFPSENTVQHSLYENISNNETKNDADSQLENNFNDQNRNTKGAKNRQNEGSPGTEVNDSKKIIINDENEKYENIVKLDNNVENPEEIQETKKKKKKKVCLKKLTLTRSLRRKLLLRRFRRFQGEGVEFFKIGPH